jgi:hypothetical protein
VAVLPLRHIDLLYMVRSFSCSTACGTAAAGALLLLLLLLHWQGAAPAGALLQAARHLPRGTAVALAAAAAVHVAGCCFGVPTVRTVRHLMLRCLQLLLTVGRRELLLLLLLLSTSKL